MESSWYWRLFLVLGLIGLGFYYAAPSAIYFGLEPDQRRSRPAIEAAIPEYLPESRFNLGIDLQGGVHLVMGVDTEKAVQDRADRVADEIVEAFEKKDKKLSSVRRPGDAPILKIQMLGDDYEDLKEILETRKDTWQVLSKSGKEVTFGMLEAWETKLREDAVSQALTTLRNRIDKYGVTEPEVRKRGNDSIMIQIAGLTADDEKRILEDIIGKTAQLEFKIVDDTDTFFSDISAKGDMPASITVQIDAFRGKGDVALSRPYLEGKDKKELLAFLEKHPPPSNRIVGVQEVKPNPEAEPVFRTFLLDRKTPLTGDSLTNAFVSFSDEENQYVVNMQFDKKGASRLNKLTTENTKRKMAIVLDDVVDSAPQIQTPIPNGSARITLGGSKTQQEVLQDANNLAVVLKAGALPAPVYPQEQRTVGATLGDDAVEKGKMALGTALLCVLILIGVYYRGVGMTGLLALAVNILFLVATLSGFNATLTLPGIAGLALTIGMAVDANIIQFERIREERLLGKTARAAVDAGFDKAFSAIFDANVTTLLAAIVLLQYGSGPIRGFATTLSIGVFINTFTAVVVPRLILDYFTRGRRVQELSI